ncbi:BDH1 [Symbiodinium natans]|uniref:BDH1 protein n=1 Tax=Symbiodinium natans TaxID=878477 RepID=A0A812QZS7_9DINO|nr:BDH1 [Symbiodinium natans]
MRCAWLTVLVLLLAGIHPCLRALLAKRFPVAPGAVLVTGASSGIGLHAAVALSAEVVVFAGVRSEKDAARLKQSYPQLRPVVLDVTSTEKVEAARKEVSAALGAEELKLVGLVNNAGISRHLIFEYENLEEVMKLYDVNVFGVYRVTQAFLPLLRASGAGRVVNVGSISPTTPAMGYTSYAGSKNALESINDVMRLELARYNISVSLLKPGMVHSALHEKISGENAAWRRAKDLEGFREHWGEWAEGFEERRRNREAHADGAEVTTEAIRHALRSEHPETRYVVANVHGIPCQALSWLMWLLPDRGKDLLLAGN